MNNQVSIRKTSTEPEGFVLVVPPCRPEPELTLGPFDEQVAREELRRVGLSEPTISRDIENARAEFESVSGEGSSQPVETVDEGQRIQRKPSAMKHSSSRPRQKLRSQLSTGRNASWQATIVGLFSILAH